MLAHHHDLLLHRILTLQAIPVLNDLIGVSIDTLIFFLVVRHLILNSILGPLIDSLNYLPLSLDETLGVLGLMLLGLKFELFDQLLGFLAHFLIRIVISI